ncbi:MAG TPA: hypothetical protein VF379_01105 [Gaiellaceae bacterium]
MITDSVGGALLWVSAAHDELTHGLDVSLEVKTCRKLVDPGCPAYGDDAPESVLATIQRLGPALGSTLVLDVGYNDQADVYAAGIDEVMRASEAAGVAKVIWVTLAERQGTWVTINDEIRAAATRWPQLVVADWAPVAAGQDWFVDEAHMNWLGAIALGHFLRPYIADACGAACVPVPVFCGLAWTVNGFDPVSAVAEIGCPDALRAVVGIEHGLRSDWQCSHTAQATYKLDCTHAWQELQVLERAPVPPVGAGDVVTLANWSFQVAGARLLGRSGAGPWHTLARHLPFCVNQAPREVLLALRLRPVTAKSGCFTTHG